MIWPPWATASMRAAVLTTVPDTGGHSLGAESFCLDLGNQTITCFPLTKCFLPHWTKNGDFRHDLVDVGGHSDPTLSTQNWGGGCSVLPKIHSGFHSGNSRYFLADNDLEGETAGNKRGTQFHSPEELKKHKKVLQDPQIMNPQFSPKLKPKISKMFPFISPPTLPFATCL